MLLSIHSIFKLIGFLTITTVVLGDNCSCDETIPTASCDDSESSSAENPSPSLDVCTCNGEKIVIRYTNCNPRFDDHIALYKQNDGNRYVVAESYQYICGGPALCDKTVDPPKSGVLIFSDDARLPQSIIYQQFPFEDATYVPIYEHYDVHPDTGTIDLIQTTDDFWNFAWSSSNTPDLAVTVTCSFPFSGETLSACNDTNFPELFPPFKPALMKFVYKGGDCFQSDNLQIDNGEMCEDVPGIEHPIDEGTSAFIQVFGGRGDEYYSGTVPVGGTFEIDNDGDVDIEVMIYEEDVAEPVLMQSVEIIVGASGLIAAGDRFGSLVIAELEAATEPPQRSYGYAKYAVEVCNGRSVAVEMEELTGYYGITDEGTSSSNRGVDFSHAVADLSIEANDCVTVDIDLTHKIDIFDIEDQLTMVTVKAGGVEASFHIQVHPTAVHRAGAL